MRFVWSAADIFARLQLAQFARIISRCIIAGDYDIHVYHDVISIILGRSIGKNREERKDDTSTRICIFYGARFIRTYFR